jgi:hypothetical protein
MTFSFSLFYADGVYGVGALEDILYFYSWGRNVFGSLTFFGTAIIAVDFLYSPPFPHASSKVEPASSDYWTQ